jgi:hypothetical protein
LAVSPDNRHGLVAMEDWAATYTIRNRVLECNPAIIKAITRYAISPLLEPTIIVEISRACEVAQIGCHINELDRQPIVDSTRACSKDPACKIELRMKVPIDLANVTITSQPS